MFELSQIIQPSEMTEKRKMNSRQQLAGMTGESHMRE
jgi:hypothetical protein